MRARNFAGLRRIPQRGIVAGVCAGIADYFDWNLKLLRAVLVIVFLFTGAFPIVIVYCVLWYVMDPIDADTAAASGYSGGGSSGSGSGSYDGSSGPARRPSLAEVQVRFERLDNRLREIEECVTDKEFELKRELKKLEA